MNVVVFLFTLLFTLIVGRAAHLAIIERPFLSGKAVSQYLRKLKADAMRGAIEDRNQRKLAVTLELLSVAVDPTVIKDKPLAARILARHLPLAEAEIMRRLTTRSQYVRLARFVEPGEVEAMRSEAREAKVKGFLFQPDPKRFYPGGTLAAQIVGYCGSDGEGLEGLERYYNGDLSGHKATFTVHADARRRLYAPSGIPAVDHAGHNLVLTIDSTIQAIAESAIAKAVTDNLAVSGTVIVMRPETGEVLALAQAPLINPNDYGRYVPDVRRLRALTDTYEPGSTMKIFTASAAVESGLVTPETTFYCENGSFRIGGHVIHDTHHYGTLTLTGIVKVSSNIGALKVGQMIGKKRLYTTLHNFGFGGRLGLDFGGEVSGYMSPYEQWRDIHAGTIAFGQGISVTAMQVITGACAIANGGVLMKPYLVSAVTDSRGRVVKSYGPRPVRRVISEDTARKVREMMAEVVREGGTGTKAAMSGYTVCGKTGTAQKVVDRVYAKGKYIASFVGFVPKDKPALAIIAILDEPRGKQYYGGIVSAPVFKEIAERALPYFNIPPENPAAPETAAAPAGYDDAASAD